MEIRKLFELENDIAFQQLNQQVNSFNALKILKLENYEIRHSNILAWLLDPKENHGLHDYCLRKVLEHLILHEENSANRHMDSLINILNASIMESHVYREVKTNAYRYIDLVIINQQMKFVIVIENKFYSTESKNQLEDYLEFIQQTFDQFSIIPIYLTLDGEPPSNPNYFTLSYEQIEQILNSILTLHKNQISQNAYSFIEDYHGILREKYYPNQEQILQAIEIYRNHSEIINVLFEELAQLHKPLNFEAGYPHEFKMKYKDTIRYIYNHGKNILSYSFEKFIEGQFKEDILYRSHPTTPSLLPPEWSAIDQFPMNNPKYWLGKGLVVWFNKTNDNRLLIQAEVGPLEAQSRITLLNNFEKQGIPIKESSKSKTAVYTKVFTKKMDINRWDDISEITLAMQHLYNDLQFATLRKQIANALNNEETTTFEVIHANSSDDTKEIIQRAFVKWMEQKQIPSNHYRMSSRNLSFKIPLFDQFKELLGETREKWWWDNGPFLCWLEIKTNSLSFVLEVGPIEADKRILLLESIQRKGITFNKKGLHVDSKFTRIFSTSLSIQQFTEPEILNLFQSLDENKELKEIIKKLYIVYNELYMHLQKM